MQSERPIETACKRAIDVVVAVALAIATAPIVAVCALAISLRNPGSPIFRQTRAGYQGRPFVMFKLRTMYINADEILSARLAASATLEQEWSRYRRLRDDPRVIGALGAFLRRASLDELPQLWNVLQGDMSLVGPRPLELPVLERFRAAERAERESMRPGITGLWQVSGRSDMDMDALILLDRRYVARWSVWSDLVILCRTPAAVLTRRGAY